MRVPVKGKIMSFQRRLWFYFLLAASFLNTTTMADTAGGCNGFLGIPCCPHYVNGDMDGGREVKIVFSPNTEVGCQNSCKVQHPTSIGVTQHQDGTSSCYCEFGGPLVGGGAHKYKTCLFPGGRYVDKYKTHCPAWAKLNFCYNTRERAFMTRNCAKTCQIIFKDGDDKKMANAMKLITANLPITRKITSMESKTIQDFIEKFYQGRYYMHMEYDMEIYKTIIKPLFLQIVKNPSLEQHFPDFSSIFHHDMLPTVIQKENSNSALLESKLKTKFPKKVDESVQPQKHEVTINGTYTDAIVCSKFKVTPNWCNFNTRWISTGLYAKQGQLVTVTVPKHVIGKFEIRVGSYKDNLYSKNKIHRSKNEEPRRPCYISQLYGKNLIKEKTRLLSAYGGYIYVVTGSTSELGKFTLKFDKVIKSPTYVHGKTKKEEWAQVLASSKSPEVEIETSDIIVTIAREDIIKHHLDVPMIGKQLTQIMEGFSELQGYSLPAPHRYVYIDPDKSCLTCGAFNGYPIKDYCCIYELKTLSCGYLMAHEIGHNVQQKQWTPVGLGQVTNEIFTLYVTEVSFKAVTWLPKLSYKDKKFTDLLGVGKLNIFKMVAQECSWTTYKKFFQYYNEEIPDSLIPKTDAEKYVTIARVLSEKCNKDLIPFFQWWEWGGEKARSGLENAKKFTKNLPKWEGIINLLENAIVQRVSVQWSELQTKIWGDDQCRNIGGFFNLNFGLEDCKKKCLQTATCTAINYNKVNKGCVLRRCTEPVQPPQWQYEDYRGYYILQVKQNDVAYYGYDIAKNKTTGEKECASWCDKTEDCKAWTLRKDDNMCWIKTKEIYQINQTNFVSCSKWCDV